MRWRRTWFFLCRLSPRSTRWARITLLAIARDQVFSSLRSISPALESTRSNSTGPRPRYRRTWQGLTRKTVRGMKLVCVTQKWWDKYVEICEHRRSPVSWPTKTALFVAEGDELVAGVLIYDTTGPYLFFEHLVTNETAAPRQRLKAVKMMAEQMIPYCRTVGKYPLILVRPSHKGLLGILKRAGLVSAGAAGMTYPMEKLS